MHHTRKVVGDLGRFQTRNPSSELSTCLDPVASTNSYNNNNNIIVFQSQSSWGRLELEPTKSPKSRFMHFNSCFSNTPIQI